MALLVAVLSSLLILTLPSPGTALSLNYYDKTCPDAERIVTKVVKAAASKDKTIPATLLRMHFHDCFLRGCDASILLNSKGNNKAEKDAPPNGSLHGFYVIDGAKREIEHVCPGVVSCADILAFAARDAVVLSGGPTWDVPKGRKDGRISRASETSLLPSPLFNISQMKQSFSLRGLSLDDLAALLGKQTLIALAQDNHIYYAREEDDNVLFDPFVGAHTLGFAHCSSFESRINLNNMDPTMNPSFAASLRSICPINHKAKNAGTTMDTSPRTFDNTYYRLVLQGKGVFHTDQALLTNSKTKALVYKFATSHKAFTNAFVKSIIKLSSINGGQEVRRDCRVVN